MWCKKLEQLYAVDKYKFNELCNYLQAKQKNSEKYHKDECYIKATTLLIKSQKIVEIANLKWHLQEKILNWIFGNEKLVWQERGGRPCQETASMYLDFARDTKHIQPHDNTGK